MNLVFMIFFSITSVSCERYSNFLSDNYLQFEEFDTVYQWSYVNFTWETYSQYAESVSRRKYIPENIMLGGIKFHNNRMYVALPKHRKGVPATLTYLTMGEAEKTNSLLTPYPSWEVNDEQNCYNLQSMLSMEIDSKGVMWVIDGVRLTNNQRCPPKLVLMDLENHGERIHTYIFPNEICLQQGGFLNDIVIDETDGDYAYITDNSDVDPGIIIFSKQKNVAWKIRDQSMFAERYASNFIVNNYVFSQLASIDGIALSPKYSNRTMYYSALTAFSLYGIETDVLKNKELCKTNIWRYHVRYIGSKEGQSDGMIMDNRGNLYYTLMALYGVGRWNIFESFEDSEVIYMDSRKLIWTDGFGMDQNGNLYLVTSRAYTFLDLNYTLLLTNDIKFGVYRLYTGTKSYLYN